MYEVNCGMNMKRYPYRLTWVSIKFEFDSIGPRGVINKVVGYKTKSDNKDLINLSLGDWNEQLRKVDCEAKSGNDDTNMVLATVAATCLAMVDLYPEIQVYAEGATDSRNRLYRMGIVKNWDKIKSILDVEGLRLGRWEPFDPNQNYEAFIAKRKYK